MLNIQPAIKREIDEFLKEDLSKHGNVDSVILCGSQATGKATERSDIDLCYIGELTAFSRESLFYGSREFQLMIAPWSWYQHVVREHERKGNNGTITVMLAKGHCLRGCTDAWRELRQLACHYYDVGPNPPSAEEIQKIRVRISDLWGDYCDKVDSRERRWLYMGILQQCVEALFILRQWWATKAKYQLEELRSRDGTMANLVETCLDSLGSNEHALYDLCSHVLSPVGGWMKEPWRAK